MTFVDYLTGFGCIERDHGCHVAAFGADTFPTGKAYSNINDCYKN